MRFLQTQTLCPLTVEVDFIALIFTGEKTKAGEFHEILQGYTLR